jgi:hypothetical protein
VDGLEEEIVEIFSFWCVFDRSVDVLEEEIIEIFSFWCVNSRFAVLIILILIA